MAEGGYEINNFYQGGYSSLDPNKGELFSGYHGKAGHLSTTTDPRTANLIKDVSGKLSSGIQNIELTLISPELFDSIPKDHLKEVRRLGKLTGVDFSVHGPLVDGTGITNQGWSEVNREASERTMIDFVDRAQEVHKDGGGTIVFHSTNGPPSSQWESTPDGKQYRQLMAIDRESGRPIPIEEEKRHQLGLGERNQSPAEVLDSQNNTIWSNALRDIEFTRESANRIMNSISPEAKRKFMELQTKKITEEDLLPQERDQINNMHSAFEYLQEANLKLNSAFSKAVKFAQEDGDTKTVNYLGKLSKEYGSIMGLNEKGELEKTDEARQKYLRFKLDPQVQSESIFGMENALRGFEPKQFVPIEEFATEQSSKTFANTALAAYKKFGDKAPTIAIENPPAGTSAINTGEELRRLVVESRKKFVENAVKEGISKNKAEKTAEKLIGATWDVGHINMIRKQGFTEKDVIKQTEAIAPYVKHVHLSDNFGFEHTELPMGMGNVPLKEMMEKLPNKDTKKVIEAASWWQHMQSNPFKESLIGMGSPIYESGEGPMWNQSLGLQQSYSSGLGAINPQVHHSMYGSGFSNATLPTELGGSMPGGAGGRMSGNPME